MKTMSDKRNMTVRCARPDRRTCKGELATEAAASAAAAGVAPATDTATGAHRTTADRVRLIAHNRIGARHNVADSMRPAPDGAEQATPTGTTPSVRWRARPARPRLHDPGPDPTLPSLPACSASEARPRRANDRRLPLGPAGTPPDLNPAPNTLVSPHFAVAACLQPNRIGIDLATPTGSTPAAIRRLQQASVLPQVTAETHSKG